MKDKLLSTLGICKKAGKLIMGFDAVTEGVELGEVFLVLLTGDLSAKSSKEMAFVSAKHKIDICTAPITMEENLLRLGKRSGILGITDQGLADAVKRTAGQCAPRAIEED